MKESENTEVKKQSVKRTFRDYLKPEYFIISQNAEWKAVFDSFNLIVIGYSCMTTVFFVTFDMKIPLSMKQVDYFVTAIFASDFFFNFFLEYQDKETF